MYTKQNRSKRENKTPAPFPFSSVLSVPSVVSLASPNNNPPPFRRKTNNEKISRTTLPKQPIPSSKATYRPATTWPKLATTWPEPGQSWPKLAKAGHKPAKAGQARTNGGQKRTAPDNSWSFSICEREIRQIRFGGFSAKRFVSWAKASASARASAASASGTSVSRRRRCTILATADFWAAP
jgi:hypothetical protein